MKAFSVKVLQATIGINTKETGKVDRHALKRVSGACACSPETFQIMMKIDIVSGKPNFYL